MSVGAENLPFDEGDAEQGEFQLRTMTYTDLKHVIAIEVKAYTHPWTVGILRDCLRVGYSSWVLLKGKNIIGYGIVMLAAGEAHILNLCVDVNHQGKGLGRKLLNFMSDKAMQSEIDMILLEVRRSNQSAINLYMSEGFHELGVRDNYYPAEDGREDAIIFAKYLAGKMG
jgi:ribosomal-protein-alanine N-acetyltransferase